MQTKSPGFNAMVEKAWKSWAAEVRLARKLRTLVKAKLCDGESFAIVSQNPAMRHEVKLGLRLIECEQVSTPFLRPSETNKIDGLKFDEFGNPIYYEVLKRHPGSSDYVAQLDAEQIPARFMLHLFREDRVTVDRNGNPDENGHYRRTTTVSNVKTKLVELTITVGIRDRVSRSFDGECEVLRSFVADIPEIGE